MTGRFAPTAGSGHCDAYAPVLLREDSLADLSLLTKIRADPRVEVIDHRGSLLDQLREIRPALTADELAEPGRWSYYPWRRVVVSVLGPRAFRRVRLDRNRNKITSAEQEVLGRLKVGVIGLSVGHAIAHTLALEGLCSRLRLADHDAIELSNLNRVPATVLDLGINKAVVVARRIAELDPYTRVEILTEGLTEKNMASFFDGLDLVIEECDSLDMKLRVRQEARTRGIPVLMETSDRGMLDVERFDVEPDREPVHGLLGVVDARSLRDLSTRDKAPYVMKILQGEQLSARMAASMVEIDQTVSSWPQLGGEVQLGAATVAAAVRRFGRGERLPSGRVRIDVDSHLDELGAQPVGGPPSRKPSPASDLTLAAPPEPMEAVIHAIRLGPSGGNSQPWSITASPTRVDIHLVAERTSAMDVKYRGSYVAIGAATFNARVAAARHSVLGPIRDFPEGPGSDVIMSVALADGTDPILAEQYPAMLQRISNRSLGRRRSLSDELTTDLRRAAEAEGAKLSLIVEPDRLAELADLLAESDRLRYLTPTLHAQMISELQWPGRDRLDKGIDVRTLALDATDLTKLQVASRADVMTQLASWQGGHALGDGTRERINASSALAVVSVDGDTPNDYLRGGAAAQRTWIRATHGHLGVQPVSPVFLYARNQQDLDALSNHFAAELAILQARFGQISGLKPADSVALVLRLTHNPGPVPRSERLTRSAVVSTVQR
jgi:tRNA A37 threonylcarbamoyladenosine dehydratase